MSSAVKEDKSNFPLNPIESKSMDITFPSESHLISFHVDGASKSHPSNDKLLSVSAKVFNALTCSSLYKFSVVVVNDVCVLNFNA